MAAADTVSPYRVSVALLCRRRSLLGAGAQLASRCWVSTFGVSSKRGIRRGDVSITTYLDCPLRLFTGQMKFTNLQASTGQTESEERRSH